MADTGPNGQTYILSILRDYVLSTCERLEVGKKSDPYLSQVDDFPSFSTLYPSQKFNWEVVAKAMADYEFKQVRMANLLAELTIKKTQAKVYLQSVLDANGKFESKTFIDNINFLLGRITELELALKIRMDAINSCMIVLRSLKQDAPR